MLVTPRTFRGESLLPLPIIAEPLVICWYREVLVEITWSTLDLSITGVRRQRWASRTEAAVESGLVNNSIIFC